MGNAHHPELRGFDSYELKLGDQLRGERASKGKSLLDVQRELRIRAEYIDAIENADASAFPANGFAGGYIRSYAKYLDLDADDVLRRFCEESGFKSVTITPSVEPTLGGGEAKPPIRTTKKIDDLVVSTRFAASNAREARLDLGASLKGLASIAVLACVVGGLGFGGWTILQNLQRVGFAPIPSPPIVLVTAPDITAPQAMGAAAAAEAPAEDAPRITLAELYAAQEALPPEITPRDGPISSINPMEAGIYAPPEPVGPPIAVAELAAVPAEEALTAELLAEMPAPPPPPLIDIVRVFATEDAWIRVRDGDGRVLFTGILGPGENFVLPAEAENPELRAGNAGAVYLVVNGAAYGPLGRGPEVAKNVGLTPEAIRGAWPAATDLALSPPLEGADQSAVAQLPGE